MSFAKEKVGKLIKIGGEHLVYNYAENQVLKYPNILARILFNQQQLANKKASDLQLAQKYFSHLVLITEYFRTTGGKYSYCLIQPKIKVRYLKIADLENPLIRKQFLEIIEINDLIKVKEKLSFDFLGAWRLILDGLANNNTISNLMVTDQEKIIIVDTVFLEYQGCQWSKILHLISYWAEKRQQKFLKKFINYAKFRQ